MHLLRIYSSCIHVFVNLFLQFSAKWENKTTLQFHFPPFEGSLFKNINCICCFKVRILQKKEFLRGRGQLREILWFLWSYLLAGWTWSSEFYSHLRPVQHLPLSLFLDHAAAWGRRERSGGAQAGRREGGGGTQAGSGLQVGGRWRWTYTHVQRTIGRGQLILKLIYFYISLSSNTYSCGVNPC